MMEYVAAAVCVDSTNKETKDNIGTLTSILLHAYSHHMTSYWEAACRCSFRSLCQLTRILCEPLHQYLMFNTELNMFKMFVVLKE